MQEDLWKAAFPVGTEVWHKPQCWFLFIISLIVLLLIHIHVLLFQWDQLDSVYQFNWNFSNLEVSLRTSQGSILVYFLQKLFIRIGDIIIAIIVRMHLKREESCTVRKFIFSAVQSVSSLTDKRILFYIF